MKNHWLQKSKKNWGFPQDDAYSIMQGDFGSANLEIWYNDQFIQNEWAKTACCRPFSYKVQHTPVLESSMTGTVYIGTDAYYIFWVANNGTFNFTTLKENAFKINQGSLNLKTGEVDFVFDINPQEKVTLVVSYEYKYSGS